MNKKLIALTLSILTLFSSVTVFADTIEEPKVYEEVVKELEEAIEEIEEVQKNRIEILQDKKFNKTMNEMINLQKNKKNTEDEIRDIIEKVFEKSLKISEIVNKQVEMKTLYLNNSKEVYDLTIAIEDDFKIIVKELKRVAKEGNITLKEYENIRQVVVSLIKEMQEVEYAVGNIAKESRIYINYVGNKQFNKAIESFETILGLQGQQIDMLRTIYTHTTEIKELLEEI
ncbi:hypothetical protein [Anaerosalibacter massiliensis]|uniref:hypothetical protein n=1 Tax=Anaerosalibacter massiliensis TaxID=1347392 RepID=UPI0005B2E2F8|nr:hypothetical protein [Anaerosalibacter massiliensis]